MRTVTRLSPPLRLLESCVCGTGLGNYAKPGVFLSNAPYKVLFSPPLPSEMKTHLQPFLSKSMKFPFISQTIQGEIQASAFLVPGPTWVFF